MPDLARLPSQFKGTIDTSAEARAVASRDASLFAVTPDVVATPRDTEDVKTLVAWAQSEGNPVALTPRSGGTDMSGGPLTASVVVDMQPHFQTLGEVKNRTATVQPGAWYRDLEKHVAPHNLMLPPYPASKDICTVGGMVGNNAGGEKTLVYGKTAEYVTQIKAVLSDAKEYVFRPLTRPELDEKMAQADFEGELYRRLFQLLDEHATAIQAARPKVSKNSAGYALWDVWNQATGVFDLTRLFTGSQGTLGIITEITFRLITPRPHTQMLVMFLDDIAPLADIVKTTLTYAPEAFESYDDHTLRLALRFLPQLWRKMKTKNLFALLKSFLPEIKMIIRGGLPRLILIAEFSGFGAGEVSLRAQAAQAALRRFGIRTHRAQSPVEEMKYWVIRRESFNLLRQHVKDSRTAPFIDDLIVPPETLPDFLPLLNQILAKYDLVYTIAGHVGDGNFHIIPLMDPRRPDFVAVIEKLLGEVTELVLKFGGSLTAEHNDGLIRSHLLKDMFGEEIYSLFVEVKNLFDPNHIFNPGKKTNADWNFAKAHLDRG